MHRLSSCFILLLCAALLAALFAGCTQRTAPTGGDPDTPPAQNNGDSPDQPAQPTHDQPQPAPETPSGDAPQLTTPDNEDELLAVMQDALFGESQSGRFYRQALTSRYASAAGVDLGMLFYNGVPDSTGLNWDDLSAPEQSALKKSSEYSAYFLEADWERISTTQMDQAMQTVFGIGLGDASWAGVSRWVYLPEFDQYYFAHTDTNALLPIQAEQVQTDADGYYYLFYRLAESPDNQQLCCLRRVKDSWQIVYNLDAAEGIPSGREAQCAASGSASPLLLRPAVSDDLALAVTLALEPSLRSLAPSDAALLGIAQDILAVQTDGTTVTVYAAAAYRAYDDGQGEITELSSAALPVELSFCAYPSSGRICYELSSLRYRDDPSGSQLFPELTWLEASGLTMADLEPPLLKACAEDLARQLAQPLALRDDGLPAEVLYAALSSDDALTAAAAVADAGGTPYGITRYQRVAAAENPRATAALLESYADQDAHFSAWTAEEARQRLLAVDISYALVYRVGIDTPESGVYQQTYLLCRDPGSGFWRVWSVPEAAQLITYQPG